MPRRAYGLFLAMLALPSIALAQGPEVSIGVPSPAAEFTAAFSLDGPKDVNLRPTCLQLSLPCSSGKEFGDYGWSLSAGYSFTDNVAVVGEFAGFENFWLAPHQNRDSVNHVHTLMAGPRIASRFLHVGTRDPNDLRLFVQVLGGLEVSELDSGGLAFRPGGGVDVSTRTGILVRVEIDYLTTSAHGRDMSGCRVLLGLVFGAGAK